MSLMYFNYFIEPSEFPFYLYNAFHDENFEMHTHADFSELAVVLDGAAIHCVGEEAYFVKRGDVYAVNGDTEHGYRNTENFRICNIMYRPEILTSPFFDLRKSAGFHALFVIEPYLAKSRNFDSRLTLGVEEFERVKILLNEMAEEYEKKDDGWQTVLHSLFMTLITMLSRLYLVPSSSIKTNAIYIAKTLSYIENRYKESVSISELAALANISERHYSRIFKETYKITPGDYILNLRLQHACSLLKNSSLKISDIAAQSGFDDGNYFSRRFHKAFGVTPSEYRFKLR